MIVVLAFLGVVSLVALPLLAKETAERTDFARPEALPPEPQPPEEREEPLAPIEELDEALRLPRVDTSPTDEHSEASIAAYRQGDYEEAFEEAVLALDPAPTEQNELYRILTTSEYSLGEGPPETVEKPNGRLALKALDDVLRPVVSEEDPQTVARLSNASATLMLWLYTRDEPPPPGDQIPLGPWMAKELAHQAADLRPDYCPALLNLTYLDGAVHSRIAEAGSLPDLDHAGGAGSNAGLGDPKPGVEYHSVEGCEDPALLYYRAQTYIHELFVLQGSLPPSELESESSTLRLAERLESNPRWAGLAHSLKGDFYYWVATTYVGLPPFAQRHYLELALWEYDAALALQPDDRGIRHGRALIYLEMGRADVKDEVAVGYINKAIREAEAAVALAQVPSLPAQTLVRAHEEKGDHDMAARLERDLLENEGPPPAPLSLVAYTPISHGADRYSEFRFFDTAGGGVFVDEEIIVPFAPRPYETSIHSLWLGYLNEYREQLRYYALLRNDLLSGDYGALREDAELAPAAVRENERTMLMLGIKELLTQPEGTPTGETQAAINDYVVAAVNTNQYATPIDEGMLEDRSMFAERIYLADYLTPSSDFDRVQPDDESRFPQNNFFYWEAANFLRQHKQYEKAIRVYGVWLAELERDGVAEHRRAVVHNLLGEALFLDEEQHEHRDYREALGNFERAAELNPHFPPYLVRQAFMYEQREHYGTAEALYRSSLGAMHKKADWMPPSDLKRQPPLAFYFPDNYHAYKHLGDVLMRQGAGAERAGSDAESVRGEYAEAVEAYRDALMTEFEQATYGSSVSVPSAPAAVSNLGVALLKAGSYEKGVEVLETLVRPPVAFDDEEALVRERAEVLDALVDPYVVPEEWKSSSIPQLPTPDDRNPVFHLNLGWAHELNGDAGKARERYLAALRIDPTFHPAMNDLGVLAVKDGELGEAKGYFDAALEEKPDYAYAAHNLGVALLSSGPADFLAGQGNIARAASHDESLAETSYDYIFDNELYFLNLSLADKVPPDWQFAAHAERSTFYISLGAVALLLWGIIRRTAYEKGRETLVGRAFGFGQERYGAPVSRFWAWVRNGWLRFSRLGRPSRSRWWVTPLALLITAPAVAVVQGWSLFWEESAVKLVVITSLVYVAMVSLLVHHAGHAVVALRDKLQVREAPWPAGIAQAVALVAVGGPFVAPMPATSVEGDAEERKRQSVLLAGPLASILFAMLLYALYIASHIPLFNFGAVLNLGLAAASLLSLPPLEGATIGEGYYTRWTFWMATFVTVMSAFIAISSFF